MNLGFRTVLPTLISLTSSSYAGNWTSPTEGQTLHVNQPFTFRWQASHPYATTPKSVMVLLSLGTFSSAKAGTTLAYELTPTSSSTGTYTATLSPILAYDSPAGSYQLVVVESYNGYLNVPHFAIDTLNVVVGA